MAGDVNAELWGSSGAGVIMMMIDDDDGEGKKVELCDGSRKMKKNRATEKRKCGCGRGGE